MGYDITIGQYKRTSYTEDGIRRYLDGAIHARHETAPAFGEPTDYENQRWPSYGSWNKVLEAIGLKDLFRNPETGLMRKHPGCVKLTIEHKKAIDEAYANFYAKHPDCKPGYSKKQTEDPFGVDPDWPKENAYAVRLEWIKYWVDWALENCKQPVIVNT
jgi:hypothetical protein